MEMDRLEEEAQTDVDKEIEEEIEQARAADAAKAASPPPKRGSVLAAVSSKLSTFRLGASPEPAPGDDAAAVSRERYAKRLEDGIEASVECGRVVGGARYYSVRCRRAGFQPATVAHPLTAFRDCRAALRSAGQAELVRSDFPLPRSASLESLGSLFRGDDDARREADDAKRAAALDAWLSEVVTLAKWGTLAPGVVAEVRALLHADELEPEVVIAAPAPAPAAAAPRARRGGAPRRSQSLKPATFSALPQVEEAAPAAAPGAAATDVEAKARRIAELETVVASLKKRIATIDPGNDVEASLEDLERQLRDTAAKLLAGDESVENELERLDKAIRSHPEHAERVALAAAKWEAAQKPRNAAALRDVRRFVPENIFKSTAKKIEVAYAARAARGDLPPRAAAALAKRVWTTQVLWLVWLDPERIAKLHPADLRGRYAVTGLDIEETRAVYAVLPASFDNDPSGDKTRWRAQIRTKLEEFVDREARQALTTSEARHAAYRPAPAALDVNDGTVDADDPTQAAAAPSLDLDARPAAEDAPKRPKLPKPPVLKEDVAAPKKKKAQKAAPVDLLAALKNRENKRRHSTAS